MKTTTYNHPQSNRSPARSASQHVFGVTPKHMLPGGFREGIKYYIQPFPENHSSRPCAAGARRVLNGSKPFFKGLCSLSKQRLGFA